MYKNLIDIFKENEGKGAVGAFNVHCFEMVPAMIEAAEQLNVPVILQTSLGTAEYIGFEPLIAAVKAIAQKATVNVALHMDHCKSVEALKKRSTVDILLLCTTVPHFRLKKTLKIQKK